MNIEKTVEVLNDLLIESCAHGGDIGGIYARNENDLRIEMEKAIDYFGLVGYEPYFDRTGWPEIRKKEDA